MLTNCWSCCFWTNGTEIKVNNQSKRVPKNASQIYNIIPNEKELNNKSKDELEALLNQVRTIAHNCEGDKNLRDKNTTGKFYTLLANKECDPKTIFESLQRGDFFQEDKAELPKYIGF